MDTSNLKQYGNFTFKEVAMVAAIMGDYITKKLYAEVQKQGHGYMVTIDTIGDWAIEFAKKHEKTSWEKVLEDGMKPLSKQFKNMIVRDEKLERRTEASTICCWDDAVMDFANFKFEQFKK